MSDKIKRYLVFGFFKGGWNDCQGAFYSIMEARKFISETPKLDANYQIVDLFKGAVIEGVYESKWPPIDLMITDDETNIKPIV